MSSVDLTQVQAGPELDYLVTEKVVTKLFGWKKVTIPAGAFDRRERSYYLDENSEVAYEVPKWSSDLNLAWRIVEALGLSILVVNNPSGEGFSWCVKGFLHQGIPFVGDDVAVVICRAALSWIQNLNEDVRSE